MIAGADRAGYESVLKVLFWGAVAIGGVLGLGAWLDTKTTRGGKPSRAHRSPRGRKPVLRATLAVGVVLLGWWGSRVARDPVRSTAGSDAPAQTEPPSAAPTTNAGPAVAAIPTTSIRPMSDAQVAFFLATNKVDVHRDALTVGAPVTWELLPAYCAEAAVVVGEFATDLLAFHTWPSSAQDEIDSLVAVSNSLVVQLDRCASLPSTHSALTAIDAEIAATNDELTAARAAALLSLDA